MLKGDSVDDTCCFPNAPMQAAEIKQALRMQGTRGCSRMAKTPTTASISRSLGHTPSRCQRQQQASRSAIHHVWSGLPLPERMSPGQHDDLTGTCEKAVCSAHKHTAHLCEVDRRAML